MAYALFAIFLVPLLVTASIVDAREMRIPDAANLLLFAGGIAFWQLTAPQALPLQLGTAVAVFALLFALRAGHRSLAGRTGLGLGDVKMIAACSVWFDPTLFPIFLLISTATATIAVLAVHHRSGAALSALRIPFAPFLSLGLLVTWSMELVVA